MAIPWTNDTIQDSEQLRTGTDELDSQSTITHFNFVSQSISVGELRSQCNTNRQIDDSFIETTHSRVLALQRENMVLKSKLNCFICKLNQFTHVLIPCSHVVCGDCVKLTICSCSMHIGSSHPCTLSSIPHTTEQEISFSSSISSSDLLLIDFNTS